MAWAQGTLFVGSVEGKVCPRPKRDGVADQVITVAAGSTLTELLFGGCLRRGSAVLRYDGIESTSRSPQPVVVNDSVETAPG
jgi:hypothetical protein